MALRALRVLRALKAVTAIFLISASYDQVGHQKTMPTPKLKNPNPTFGIVGIFLERSTREILGIYSHSCIEICFQ